MGLSSARRMPRYTAFAAVVAVAVVLTATVATPVAATEQPGPTERQQFSLTISPARLVIRPGTGVVHRRITAFNTGSTPLEVTVVLSGFRQERDGTIVFDDPGASADSSWIDTQPGSFHLAPHHKRQVRLTAEVPADAEPGDHSIGVVFLVPSERSTDNLTIDRGVGTQMFLQVPGPVVHDISLSSLDVPTFSTGGDIPLELTVRNSGTVHEDYFAPDGQVTAEAENSRVSFPDFTVLSGVTRQVDVAWSDAPWFCHCEVAVTVSDGHGGTSTARATVWILPVKQAAGGLLFVIGLVLLIRWRRHRREAALSTARQEGYDAAQSPTKSPGELVGR